MFKSNALYVRRAIRSPGVLMTHSVYTVVGVHMCYDPKNPKRYKDLWESVITSIKPTVMLAPGTGFDGYAGRGDALCRVILRTSN